MGVAGEVLENLFWPSERAFGVHDPFFGASLSKESFPRSRVSEFVELSKEAKLTGRESALEVGEKFAAKKSTQDSNRKEKVLLAGNPALAIEGEPAGGNDAVEVGM